MSQGNPQTHCKAVTLFVPTAVSGTTTLNNSSPNLDVEARGFAEALVIVTLSDAVTLVGDTLAVQIKESDTAGSAYSDVTGALVTLTGTSDNTTFLGRIKLEGRKRYLSATMTETGTFVGTVAVHIVLLSPEDTALTAQTYTFNVT